MTTHVLNSAMMPLEGSYSIKKVDRHHFFGRIKEVRAMNDFLMSWIGYEQNADVIEANTGWRPPICRDVTKIDHGDRLLMMRLKYRPEQRAKGFQVDAHDFEYFEAYYVEQTPVPSWHDLMGMNIHEATGLAYPGAIYRLRGEKIDTKEEAVEIAVQYILTCIHRLEQLRDKYDKMLDDIYSRKMEEHGNG